MIKPEDNVSFDSADVEWVSKKASGGNNNPNSGID